VTTGDLGATNSGSVLRNQSMKETLGVDIVWEIARLFFAEQQDFVLGTFLAVFNECSSDVSLAVQYSSVSCSRVKLGREL